MLQQRRMVSFLMSEGHPDAAHYPIALLWSEATIAQQRVNVQHATTASLMQSVIATVLGGKEAHEALRRTLKDLTDGL